MVYVGQIDHPALFTVMCDAICSAAIATLSLADYAPCNCSSYNNTFDSTPVSATQHNTAVKQDIVIDNAITTKPTQPSIVSLLVQKMDKLMQIFFYMY